MALLISADDLKSTIPGYDPSKSDAVHHESARLADREYVQALRQPEYPTVYLLSGGGASGKTEYMSEYLMSERAIIMDGTLPSFAGAKIKAQAARKSGKHVSIHAVWPEDFKIAFSAFLGRDRKYPDQHFYSTHSRARAALLEIAESNLDVEIAIIESQYENSKLRFFRYEFETTADQIEFIREGQYTEEEIRKIILEIS